MDDRAARLAADRAIINQIGKPIVPLAPSTPSWYYQRSPTAASQPRWGDQKIGTVRNPYQTTEIRKSLNRHTYRHPIESDMFDRLAKIDSAKYAPTKPSRTNTIASDVEQKFVQQVVACNWMSSDEIKNLTLPTNELIVRDSIGSPAYIIRFRALIRLKDNAYFPLRNILSHLYLKRVYQLPNLSEALNPTSTRREIKLLESEALLHRNLTYSHDWLEEEMFILVECGYLIIEVLNDGMFLLLKSISFYKSPNLPNGSDGSNLGKSFLHRQTDLHLIKTIEHLVFATDYSTIGEVASHQVTASQGLPLLIMPIRSRYICQNRIVLIGNNSVQLILDEFEMKRVSGIAKDNSTPFRPTVHGKLPLVETPTSQMKMQYTGDDLRVINTDVANKRHDGSGDIKRSDDPDGSTPIPIVGARPYAEREIATLQGFSSQHKPKQQPSNYGEHARLRRLATIERDLSTMLQGKHHANGKSPAQVRRYHLYHVAERLLP